MRKLLVGFDSAWTPDNRGGIVGVIQTEQGSYRVIDLPQVSSYVDAENIITQWQLAEKPTETVILLDQPTIVQNASGQRPVENLIASPVSRRYGGVQPANTSKGDMFGAEAPVWKFLDRFGGAADPFDPSYTARVYETYPVAVMISLGWILPDARRDSGRLPKYNPERRKTFSIDDWVYVCDKAEAQFQLFGLPELARFMSGLKEKRRPGKADQDKLDSCLCLLVAILVATGEGCMVVGDVATGYMILPDGKKLREELTERCRATGRSPEKWVRSFPRY